MKRAELFGYVGLDITSDSLTGHYELDGRPFAETVTFEGVNSLEAPAVKARPAAMVGEPPTGTMPVV